MSSEIIRLAPDQLAELAELVAAELRGGEVVGAPQRQLVDARTAAGRLGVDLKTVYRRADELGAVRVGRALRFDLERVGKVLATAPADGGDRPVSERPQPAEPRTATRRRRSRRPARKGTDCQLLPIGRVEDR
jgi:hypothetical protein